MDLKSHDLVNIREYRHILYEERPVLAPDSKPAEGLHNVWITINNEAQLNSYTTDAVKEIILAFRRASNDRAAVSVVFTGAGTRAFCTGGNTREYAEVYANRPTEYRQYMRLFNDMVTSILTCDKPVICRVNGMRVAGGQEIGMACDFSIAQDLAVFGQAGPKHGSAPDGGSTDFLPLFVGIEAAMYSCTACETWSAHRAFGLGLLTQVVPALRVDGEWMPNPFVWTDGGVDSWGRPRQGLPLSGESRERAKELMTRGTVDLTLLDREVETLCTKLLMTMPECLTKTIESVRKHKLLHWERNHESNRAWLALNMLTEANVGFRVFNEATGKQSREADFIELRRRLARGECWSEDLIKAIWPKSGAAK